MIKHFCDRCEKECLENVYYITIFADSICSINGLDHRQTVESASVNISSHLTPPKIYCKKCCTEIKEFMNKGGKTDQHRKEGRK